MDVGTFQLVFEHYFPRSEHARVSVHFEDAFSRSFFDTCFDVKGMASLKKLKLLNIGFNLLPEGEAYFELGTFHGKSLISAMLGNAKRQVFACDNFSEFSNENSLEILKRNLTNYKLIDDVTIFDEDFRDVASRKALSSPIGLYFNDGPHDEASQYDAIRHIEPFLADEALVVIDDWRLAQDSGSYAEAGTHRAIAASTCRWEQLYTLPARYNGDQGLWWNGVAVYGFRRA